MELAPFDDNVEEHTGNEWLENILKFATEFEDEGVFGLAQATVAQTTSIAVSIASTATTTAFHVVSEASAGAGRLLTGNNRTNSENDIHLAAFDESISAERDDDDTPLVIKIASKIIDIMLGAISPLLVKDNNRKENQFQNHCALEIKADIETSSLSHFFDAECCDESVYFDASDSTHTLSTASYSSSSPTEDQCDEEFDLPIPKNVVVREETPAFYLDFTDMISQVDQDLVPLISIEKDNTNGMFYAVSDTADNKESLRTVLDVLVERSLSIAMMDGSQSTGGDLHWKPDGHTKKTLKHHNSSNSEEWTQILESEVLKWTGTSTNNKSNCPMLKTQGIVDMVPLALKELLLDCDRVHLFNKNSMGKEDVCTFASVSPGETKIVKNTIKIPVVGGTIQTISLTHSQFIENGGFIIISQSVSETLANPTNPFYSISILRSVPNSDKTELTNIAQISSMPIPKFLMRKVGFMGAVDFFNNLRSLCG